MNSIVLVTALSPVIDYETSTQVAKKSLNTGKGVYDIVLEKELLSKEALEELLNPENMNQPKKFIP